MRAWVALILLALPASAAPVPKELKKKNDLDRIAGSWVVVAHCNGGGKIVPGDGAIWKFDTLGKASVHLKDAAPRDGVKFELGESGTAKTFDWVAPWGEWYGVYELTDDTLTTYLSPKGVRGKEGRHMELKTGPGVEMNQYQRSALVK